jgi:hypothetical protein
MLTVLQMVHMTSFSATILTSVSNPHHIDADPDPDPPCHFDADPDLTFHSDAVPDPSFQIKA